MKFVTKSIVDKAWLLMPLILASTWAAEAGELPRAWMAEWDCLRRAARPELWLCRLQHLPPTLKNGHFWAWCFTPVTQVVGGRSRKITGGFRPAWSVEWITVLKSMGGAFIKYERKNINFDLWVWKYKRAVLCLMK